LIIPGYIVGITCLMIMTYRSIIAFLDENKVITISVNKYGEQYFDIVALVVIWCVCLISLFFLIKILRQEIVFKENNNKFQKESVSNEENNFFDLNPKIKVLERKTVFIGYVSKSYNKVKNKFK
jgi:hypothetical protein